MIQRRKLFNFIVFLPCLILCLAGCVNENHVFMKDNKIIVGETSPNDHIDHEMMIAQISDVLLVSKLKKEERAILHFERGVLYDSLGLWTLARFNFQQALALYPKLASAFNYLGLYLLLDQDYETSLEAFNMVFELDPKYEYAFLNRGLNFHYVERYELAHQDFLQFYQLDKSDPYRVLWLYFNELKRNPKEAKQNLALRANLLNHELWGTYIVQYYLGNLSVEELLTKAQQFTQSSSAKSAEVLTETYFYLAKQQLNLGQVDKAETLFKLAVANQVYNFVEYRFALFELMKLKQGSNQK
ncbi:lipoprotein NlpI [Pasteurella dagmatis]|nr:lipoprotein NlpI [Pasteurella dagmatis]SNV55203.1 lipoprotein NlpI [Pasteurella dagmatis]